MSRQDPGVRHWPLLPLGVVASCALLLSACGSSASAVPQSPGPTPSGAVIAPSMSVQPATGASSSLANSPTASAATESQGPDASGGTTSGDVPDNAVFLTYQQAALRFSIQYVEGWQVTTQPDGVVIRDKDSSESVAVVATSADPTIYATETDLLALGGQAGFNLVKRDTVKVGVTALVHLKYHIPAPPDPVTGKQVPSTVDRYYVPGTGAIAIVSLATPDGVDNVDAFRQMIESFAWY
jgi:hypothetical protein